MNSTDHELAREEMRKRQWAVCARVIDAGREKGANLSQCNEALKAAGLPTIADVEEWDYVQHGPISRDPAYWAAQTLMHDELTSILRSSPTWSDSEDARLVDIAAGLGLTLDEAHKQARQRVLDELRRRGADQNDREALLELFEERNPEDAKRIRSEIGSAA